MPKQTSIHLRPCKQSSEVHNKREKALDYVRSDLSPLNEWWSAVPSLGERHSQISALVKEKTGRKMQAKAEPFREGVVVIKEDTTMEELQELGIRFQEKFGVTPVQIAIHKDEGHWQGEVWKPNLHAHIVFDWYDHSTGKSIKTTSLDAIEMHLQRKFSLSWDIRDHYVRDYLKNSIGFTEVEIKNNIEVFRRASELLPDLLSELTLLKGKSRDKKNPKGWII